MRQFHSIILLAAVTVGPANARRPSWPQPITCGSRARGHSFPPADGCENGGSETVEGTLTRSRTVNTPAPSPGAPTSCSAARTVPPGRPARWCSTAKAWLPCQRRGRGRRAQSKRARGARDVDAGGEPRRGSPGRVRGRVQAGGPADVSHRPRTARSSRCQPRAPPRHRSGWRTMPGSVERAVARLELQLARRCPRGCRQGPPRRRCGARRCG